VVHDIQPKISMLTELASVSPSSGPVRLIFLFLLVTYPPIKYFYVSSPAYILGWQRGCSLRRGFFWLFLHFVPFEWHTYDLQGLSKYMSAMATLQWLDKRFSVIQIFLNFDRRGKTRKGVLSGMGVL